MGVVQIVAYTTDCAQSQVHSARPQDIEEYEQKIRFYGDGSLWSIAKQGGDDRAVYFFADAGKSPNWKSKCVRIGGETELRNPVNFIGILVWLF